MHPVALDMGLVSGEASVEIAAEAGRGVPKPDVPGHMGVSGAAACVETTPRELPTEVAVRSLQVSLAAFCPGVAKVRHSVGKASHCLVESYCKMCRASLCIHPCH